MKKKLIIAAALMSAILALSGCGSNSAVTDSSTTTADTSASSILSSAGGSNLDTSELFSDRDMEQSADLSGAERIELSSGEDVTITEEGVYVISGEVKDVTVIIEAEDEAKVQIVLDGVSIENEDAPAIYVKSADKVFVTTTDSDNVMKVTGAYEADGDTNLDAVIFSKSDLVLNGTGTLEIVSAEGNGITSKDDLKVTGGTYSVTSLLDGLEANDSICIAGGNIEISAKKDALHSENEDDSSLGYIYILDGELSITADDNGVQGTSIVQIDGGAINIETCREGITGTYIQINGGEISIYATDDGINAAENSDYDIVIEFNGGTIDIEVGSGDTDAVDSNGDIYVNGGTITITANSAFDSQGVAELNGGTVTVNGEKITEITQSQMGGKDDRGGKPGIQ